MSSTRPYSPSAISQGQEPTESMEVTREEYFRKAAMEERSATTSSSNQSSKSSPNRNKGGGVKTRIANLLRPRHSRGISVPVVPRSAPSQEGPMSRLRADSMASAPAILPQAVDLKRVSSRHSTPRRSHSSVQDTSHSSVRRKKRTPSPPSDHDNSSVVSDNMTVEGLRSVATNQTISSVETVKVSNKTELTTVEEDKSTKHETTPWGKIKRVLTPFKAPSSPVSLERTRSGASSSASSTKKGGRMRIQSYDRPSSPNEPSGFPSAVPALLSAPVLGRSRSSGDKSIRPSEPVEPPFRSMASLDQCIRGRLDGMDIMTLGSVLWVNSPSSSTDIGAEKPRYPWEDTRYSVTGQSTLYSPADLIKDMLWTSGGRTNPEMILEGFLPGPEDRWSVQIESSQNPKYAFTYAPENSGPPLLRATSTDDNTASTATDDHDSPTLSTHKLWTSLWGSDPVPSGQPNRDLLTQVGNLAGDVISTNSNDDETDNSVEDPLLSLAADSSIPIDIDEDTFIVSTRDHMMAIQDIATVPLAEGRFDTALRIMEKLLLGLEKDARNERKYIRGATYHNIGLIHLWQGNYVQAKSAFSEALKERRRHMTNHMDLVVTQSRLAQSYFALERFDDAIKMLECCLRLVDDETAVIRAKILNNLAVVHYHTDEISKALRYLAQALELQREWLEGPIRRESIVYDASVVLSNMGKLYLRREDFELCCNVYEEALLLQTSIFPKEQPSVMQTYINLAWSKGLNGHSRTALRLLESCHRVQTTHYGADATATLETAGWMAHLYARAERYKEALPIYQRIRQWQKQHLKSHTSLFFISGSNTHTHPSVRMVKDAIKRIDDIAAPKTSLTAWL